MNTELEYIFTDTDTFLSKDEKNILNTLESSSSIFIERKIGGSFVLTDTINILFKLVKKGILRIFSLDTGVYIFLKDHPKCRSITIEFNSYFAKIGRTDNGNVQILNEDEKDKISFGRGFIAKWIFNKHIISLEEHIKFLTIFTSRVSYSMSIPEFLYLEFINDITKTGIEFNVLTPEYKTAHCSFCRTNFQVRDEIDIAECPNCHEQVLIR